MVKMEKFQPPSWAGIPEAGMHLDVIKDGKIVEKVPVDEKPFYLFGRNVDMVDIVAEHASCSRVHAVLIFHKSLKDRAFLMDLKSAHGTFIGHLQLEPQTAKPLQFRQEFRLGASTRTYSLKSRADFEQQSFAGDVGAAGSENHTASIIPPQASDAEIQAMTSYNTTQNMQLTKPREDDSEQWTMRKQQHRGQPLAHRKRPLLLSPPSLPDADGGHVNFRDQDEIINPEDIDPTVGKFRDMVRVEIISGPSNAPNAAKRRRLMQGSSSSIPVKQAINRTSPFYTPSKVGISAAESPSGSGARHGLYSDMSTSLMPQPNLTPEVAFGASGSASMNFGMDRRGSVNSDTCSASELDRFPSVFSDNSRGAHFSSDAAGEQFAVEPMDSSPYRTPVNTLDSVEHHASGNVSTDFSTSSEGVGSGDEAKRKKYVKEVWPGKAPDPMPPEDDEANDAMSQ